MPDNLSSLRFLPLKPHGFVGPIVIITAQVLMFMEVQPVATFFTPIVWWGYILFIDSLIYRLKGSSLVMSRQREFWLMLLLSIGCWLIFEGYNVLLKTWTYINLPNELWIRCLGYGLSFATIFPGIFLTVELLEAMGTFSRMKTKGIAFTTSQLYCLVSIGILSLGAPLIWHSAYLIPLVWLGFIFLLEPLNYMMGIGSLLRDVEGGDLRRVLLLLLAGLICGGLWEFWNYWAYTKWVYSVPYLEHIKIFEMPILGFLGFPAFALECYAMYNFTSTLLATIIPLRRPKTHKMRDI